MPTPAEQPSATPISVDFEVPCSAVFDNKLWKRPRKNVNLEGCLIKRIPGYDINGECAYGMNYLKQLPKGKTSADGSKYPHAGFFTWRVLAECGRLVRERKS